ncbi:UDP-glycosyltransferase UGT4-like, partial [Haematobia irritans]|uniref:UDP-glycosyltransferase UGT4-like n=1 Tax=Haematobia irritans TaxID=7368 RepID=UPI003F4FC387
MKFCRNILFLNYFPLILNFIGLSGAAKILAIFPFPGPSQYILVKPYLKTLASRGHELTVISAYPSKDNGSRYRDVAVMEAHEIQKYYMAELDGNHNLWSGLTFSSDFYYIVTRAVLRNPNVQNLLQRESFDLAIIEAANTDALYSFGPHFGIPIIGVSGFGNDIIIDELMGNPTPLAYIPSMATGFTEQMSFGEKLTNAVVQMLELIHNKWIHLPRQQKLLDFYMPHINETVGSLRKNISLYLMNI